MSICKRLRHGSCLGEISPASVNIINRKFQVQTLNEKWLQTMSRGSIAWKGGCSVLPPVPRRKRQPRLSTLGNSMQGALNVEPSGVAPPREVSVHRQCLIFCIKFAHC